MLTFAFRFRRLWPKLSLQGPLLRASLATLAQCGSSSDSRKPGIYPDVTQSMCRTCSGKSYSFNDGSCTVVAPSATSTAGAQRYRRDQAILNANKKKSKLCPAGLTACSITSSNSDGYECVDLSDELESQFDYPIWTRGSTYCMLADHGFPP